MEPQNHIRTLLGLVYTMPVQNEYGMKLYQFKNLQSVQICAACSEKADKNELASNIIQSNH